MCEIYLPYKKGKTFTGYKVVLTDEYGHHYSPYTGIRYTPGPVPEFKRIRKYAIQHAIAEQILKKMSSYDEQHYANRYTGVFTNFGDVIDAACAILSTCELPDGFSRNILEMRISGDLSYGRFTQWDVILGNHIDSIKVIQCSRTYKN
jgi:hypothetical protein